jgi:hypothetical protein
MTHYAAIYNCSRQSIEEDLDALQGLFMHDLVLTAVFLSI